MFLRAGIVLGGFLMGATAILGVLAIFYFAYRRPDLTASLFYTYIAPRFGIKKPADVRNRELRESEELDEQLDQGTAPAWEDLPHVQVEDTIVTTGTQNLSVIGRIALLVLRFPFGGSKSDKRHNMRDGTKNARYPGSVLQNGQYLFQLPIGEGGPDKWLLLEPLKDSVVSGFNNYLRGSEQRPGPAMQYAKNDQKGILVFNGFPGLGKSFQARNIVWAYARTRGETDELASGEGVFDETDEAQLTDLPKFVIFIAKEVNSSREINDPDGNPDSVPGNNDEDATWLVTFDLRGGEGRGRPMAFLGRIFRDRPTRRHPDAELIEVHLTEKSQEATI